MASNKQIFTADNFVVNNGTTAQFLKADGSLDSSAYVTGTPWSGQYLPLSGGTVTGTLDGTGNNLITDFILDTHPESNSVIIPFLNNDISYLTLRGGTASVTDNIGTVNANIFDGSPSYTSFNPTTWGTHPEGYVIEMTFHKNFNYTSKVGVSFGNSSWRSNYVKIEMYDAVNLSYSTVLETSTNTSQIVQVSTAPGGGGTNGFSKMRMTFNDFYTANNFRIAQIWLLNYSSLGTKETLLGRDGGTLYGNLTAPKLVLGSGAFLTNSYFRIGQSVNAHIQGNINNTNAGTLASSDWVATANNGTDTTNFINFGINSSANADPAWTMAGANDGYLFTNGGHLTIGTASTSKDIKFFTGGTLAANEKARIFGATGNLLLQNGGTFTDNGYKLEVGGTTRLNSTVTLQTAPTASAGGYDLLTRNTSTGVLEKVTSSTFAVTASPTFMGAPLAPTATVGTNTTQIATTAFVLANSAPNISHLEYNNTDKTVWNNGQGGLSSNTSYGDSALKSNTTGYTNSAIGTNALQNNTTGAGNSAIGTNALQNNKTGAGNSAIGTGALQYNTTGNNNSAIGFCALVINTTGGSNSAIGTNALQYNTTGNNNSAIGKNALISNTTGSNNSAIGTNALLDLAPTAKGITLISDYSGTVAGTVLSNVNSHGRTTGNSLIISGTANYNGTYTITVIDANNFYFTKAYVINETTGWFTLSGFVASDNSALGYNSGSGIITGSGNSIFGANVTGLSANLTNNIILANGTGAIKAQHDGTDWTFTGGIISPSLTGTPTAPTATVGTNTTQIATTAFVESTVSCGNYTPTLTGLTNVSSVTLIKATWTKIGNMVTVFISVNVTPSSVLATSFRITLPFTRSTGATYTCGLLGGSEVFGASIGGQFGVTSTTSGDATFKSATTQIHKIGVSFCYDVTW